MEKVLFNRLGVILLCLFMFLQANAQDHPRFTFNTNSKTNKSSVPVETIKKMERNVEAVFSEINSKYRTDDTVLNISSTNATKDGIECIRALWKTSHFRCTETNNAIDCVLERGRDGYQIRNIHVFFASGSSPEDQYQDIVIDFDLDGKICNLYEAIEEVQYQKIFENSESVTDSRYREMIANFVESFRSAYNRKDLAFLEAVYSDDALIITGTELVRMKYDEETRKSYTEREYRYRVESKDDYINRLNDNIFKYNKVIDIKFEIQPPVKHKDKPIYGVMIKQYWHSSSYDDEGWLFLIIDYEDVNAPCIHVRTWQPLNTPQEDLFGLDSPEFRIY